VFDILLLKCDVSIAVVDIVNEAHQDLRIPLYGEQSFRCLEKTNSTHFWKKELIKNQNRISASYTQQQTHAQLL